MSLSTTYVNIYSNVISGYNNGLHGKINVVENSTGSVVIGLKYSTTNLGYEFLPNPTDNGILRYRYEPNSTTTVFGFDGPNLFINITNLITNTASIINQNTGVAGLNMFVSPLTQGGVLTVNSITGFTRIQLAVDPAQQGSIQFIKDNTGTTGTGINSSTVATQFLVGSTVIATGLILKPPNDPTISSVLNMDINGNLFWNGAQINNSVNPSTSGYSSFLSTFDYVYASTIQTTTILIRGANTLQSGLLSVDSTLNLYWNGQIINTGVQNVFASTIYDSAQIINVSSKKITVSSIQGVYNQPSLPAKWLITGSNVSTPAPVKMSLLNQDTYSSPTNNGSFSGGGNKIYGNIYNGQIIAVGNDESGTYSTIQRSSDGLSWSYITANNPFSLSAYAVFYVNNIWIIGGQSTSIGVPPIIWSTDGINFFPPSSFPATAGTTVFDISYDSTKFIATVSTGLTATASLLWSLDGKSWYQIYTGGFSSGAVAVANDGLGMWVACGQSILAPSVFRIQWSMDGVNWINAVTVPSFFSFGNSVSYANGLWHIGGTATNPLNSILVSTDGKNWTGQTSGIITTVNSIVYLKDVWYATGSVDANTPTGIMTSYDGYNWSSIYSAPFFSKSFNSIYYLENVLLGQGSINFSPSTTLHVTATVSSYTINASNIFGVNSQLQSTNTTSAIISTLIVSTIISPNYLQVQNIEF